MGFGSLAFYYNNVRPALEKMRAPTTTDVSANTGKISGLPGTDYPIFLMRTWTDYNRTFHSCPNRATHSIQVGWGGSDI